MTHELFSSVPERWSEISEFPGYLVSDHGFVMNEQTQTIVKPTAKPGSDMLMVGLMGERDGRRVQFKRSLTLLVARAYLPEPSNDAFDTPINLDGNRANNHYTNLMWRPLWFARQYSKQFKDLEDPHFRKMHQHYFDQMIVDVETHVTYDNIWTAARHHGLLAQHIWIAMATNGYVVPTGQIFREVVQG